MESLLEIDRQLFRWINRDLSNPVLDALMPYWRNGYFWAPLYIFLVTFILMNIPRRGWIVLVVGALMVFLSDKINSNILKPLVNRARPCTDVILAPDLHLLIPCGGPFSFPSTHATNHFALAVFLSMALQHRIRWIWPVALLWALSVGFAQIYVGVHYPLDVLAGAALGSLLGFWFGLLARTFLPDRRLPNL